MRKIIDFFIFLYLLPLQLSNRLALYVKGKILTYDEHYIITLDVIRRYFPNDKGLVIDIGAYDGDSAIFFSKQLLNNSIIGFEPNPDVYKTGLERTRKYRNIQLHNFGFFDFSGDADLHITKNKVSSSLFPIYDRDEISPDRSEKVTVDTLDSFFKGYNSFLLIKLDVQGAELNILQHGRETLKKTKLILTEITVAKMYQGGCLYFELDSFLRDNGFVMYSSISNYNHQGAKYFDILYMNSKFSK